MSWMSWIFQVQHNMHRLYKEKKEEGKNSVFPIRKLCKTYHSLLSRRNSTYFLRVFLLHHFFYIFPTFLGKPMHRSCIIQWTYISFIKTFCIKFEKNMHMLLLCITHTGSLLIHSTTRLYEIMVLVLLLKRMTKQ